LSIHGAVKVLPGIDSMQTGASQRHALGVNGIGDPPVDRKTGGNDTLRSGIDDGARIGASAPQLLSHCWRSRIVWWRARQLVAQYPCAGLSLQRK
ncbi:hypothetical protein SB861_53885, partial [Paraburkholderia sp. SIMBA_049]